MDEISRSSFFKKKLRFLNQEIRNGSKISALRHCQKKIAAGTLQARLHKLSVWAWNISK
jgi:hypothetical protein